MHKRKSLSVITALLLTGLFSPSYAAEEGLKIIIWVGEGTRNGVPFPPNPLKNGEELAIWTTFSSLGKDHHPYKIWDCAYASQWQSDNLAVTIPQKTCHANTVGEIDLDPGGKHSQQRGLSVLINAPFNEKVARPITFRLGFRSAQDASGNLDTPVIWSTPLTVNVAP